MRLIVGCALGTLALWVGAASGHAISQRTDPQAGSPAGVIYQIPLDTGRRDAAPVLHIRSHAGGANSSGETGGNEESQSTGSNEGRFEGGVGSVSAEPAGARKSEASGAPSGGGTPSDPSSIHSENGFGSSSQVPGLSEAALRIGAGVPAAHTPGSTLPSYLLMALICLAAVAVGLIAARGTRGAPGSHGSSK